MKLHFSAYNDHCQVSTTIKKIYRLFLIVVDAATLTEVFPCFFLSCKANARV